ncbi:hypothetical protein [Photobacterium kishitanii]|uniref:hypothetical protein n=1 Tax=Photobacterium kishitanii TaxID=318456 RepID=UPI0011B1CA7A|nr:hypothetical protein [Photobacterium kishitanii]
MNNYLQVFSLLNLALFSLFITCTISVIAVITLQSLQQRRSILSKDNYVEKQPTNERELLKYLTRHIL